jgi:hypothetical protein
MGRRDEAAQKLGEILESLKERPVSDYDRVEAMSTHLGMLGESGRIDEASAVAREALPVMRRMPKFRFEPCAQLLWRLGSPESAARVLGAQAARERDGRERKQVNEERIARATLAALQTQLPSPQLSAEMALGDRLGHLDVCALMAEALAGGAAEPSGSSSAGITS